VSDRDVDQVLADLGRRLEAVASARRRRRRWPRRRLIVALAAGLSLLASTALATRSVWAPPAPDAGRGGPTVQLAAGGPPTGRWTLAAQRCADGSVAAFLHVGAAGAGRGCGGRPRTIDAYYDPDNDKTYIFAVVPATTRRARLVLHGASGSVGVAASVRPGDHLAERVGRLGPSAALVVSRAGVWTPTAASAVDGGGRVLLHCEEERCTDG